MNDIFVRPDVQKILSILEQSDQPLTSELDPVAAREMYVAMQDKVDADAVDLARIEDLTCPGPAGEIPLRLYDSQTDRSTETPVIMFFHGGGFVIGDLETHHSFCTYLAAKMELPVISVDYRLAPEAPFPAAPDDSEAATRWVAENGGVLGLSINGLIVCGDSAGGNLAIVVTQALMANPAARPVIAQFPIYPSTKKDAEGGSMSEFAEGFFINKDTMDYFHKQYAPVLDDPRTSPCLGKHEGTPPTVIITASLDRLRDQARTYAAELIINGVDTTYLEMVGNIHGFINIRKAIPSAVQDVDRMINAFKATLENIQTITST